MEKTVLETTKEYEKNPNTKTTYNFIPIDVIFYIEYNVDSNPSCFALFPEERHNTNKNVFVGYSSEQQHTFIYKSYASKCKRATPKEYKPLKSELEKIGYKLNILKKQTNK
jgi:hypothetical protein